MLGMLTDLGADVVSRPLTEAALRRSDRARARRLLQYFSVAHVADAVPVVRSIIARTQNVECLAACLRVFADVDDLDTVREYLQHPSWQVRVQAVNVLGASRLRRATTRRSPPLLSDAEWWVRYRTAKALCALPGVEHDAQSAASATEHARPVRPRHAGARARGGTRMIDLAALGDAFEWIGARVSARHQPRLPDAQRRVVRRAPATPAAADARAALQPLLEPRAAGHADHPCVQRRSDRRGHGPLAAAAQLLPLRDSWSSTTARATGRSRC